jgi:hypothetical protein
MGDSTQIKETLLKKAYQAEEPNNTVSIHL